MNNIYIGMGTINNHLLRECIDYPLSVSVDGELRASISIEMIRIYASLKSQLELQGLDF
jgi:hypothetical protein